MNQSTRSNWDYHYGNRLRRLAILMGLKGNVVLNGQIGSYIIKSVKSKDSCIEIGAGSGMLSSFLSKHFSKSTVLDKSNVALNVARKMSPSSQYVEVDIFEYQVDEKYDCVVSVGLVEHFLPQAMKRLLEIHLELVRPRGDLYIVVPAFSEERSRLVQTPAMISNFGYQDAQSEFAIESHLKSRGVAYHKIYIDKIPRKGLQWKLLRALSLLSWKILGLDIEKRIKREGGNYAMFHIGADILESENH